MRHKDGVGRRIPLLLYLVAIVAIVFLPWHVLLAMRDPAFLSFYFVNEQIARFLGRREIVNYTPLSVPAFWMATVLWLFPWFLFLPSAVPTARTARAFPTRSATQAYDRTVPKGMVAAARRTSR